jgi:uncharacterized protein YndB with AHSA1/START domain
LSDTTVWAASLRERFPYELVSHWRVPGRIDKVYDVLSDQAELPRWWPQVYTRVREIAPGDDSGRGRTLAIVTRGALPYDLTWQFTVLETERPRLIRLKASGELAGFGEWQLAEEGDEVALTYTWRIRAGKPWMQRLEFLLKPLFRMNHNYVMRQGEEGMKRELARRAGRAA